MINRFATVFITLSIAVATLPQVATARYRVHGSSQPAGAPSSAQAHPRGWAGKSGTASYYGPAFNGHQAADGSRYDQMALTAAHPWLPFGTRVKVVLAGTERSVVVTITDRMPPSRRIVDLSVGAARQLGIVNSGLAEVRLMPA